MMPISTQCREAFACPRCGAPPGEYCKSPSGRRCDGIGGIHSVRFALATDDMFDKGKMFRVEAKDLFRTVGSDRVI